MGIFLGDSTIQAKAPVCFALLEPVDRRTGMINEKIAAVQNWEELKNVFVQYISNLIPYDMVFLGINECDQLQTPSLLEREYRNGFIQIMFRTADKMGKSKISDSALNINIANNASVTLGQSLTQMIPQESHEVRFAEQQLSKYILMNTSVKSNKLHYQYQLNADLILLKTKGTVSGEYKRIAVSLLSVLQEKIHSLLNEDLLSQRRIGLLTIREKQILKCVYQGLTNKQIGKELVISEFTVKNHIFRILKKLQAENRVHALAIALSEGLVVDEV